MGFIDLAWDYGPVAVLIAILILLAIPMIKWMNKIEKKTNKSTDDSKEIHKMCEKRGEYFTDTFNRIESLESKDVGTEGEFKVINTRLDNMNNSMELVAADVKTILTHFATKGMDQ